MRIASEEYFPRAVEQMIESLRGEAIRIAMSIGVENLCKSDKSGIEELRKKMREHVFPIIKDEVRT